MMIPLDYDEPTGRVLPFPTDPFAKPAFRWRDWAAGQVATWRERRARNSGDLRADQPDRMRGKDEPENVAVAPVSARQRLDSRPSHESDCSGSPSQTFNWRHMTAVRREWAEQVAILPNETVVSVDEIRETERAVAESLYPSNGAA